MTELVDRLKERLIASITDGQQLRTAERVAEAVCRAIDEGGGSEDVRVAALDVVGESLEDAERVLTTAEETVRPKG